MATNNAINYINPAPRFYAYVSVAVPDLLGDGSTVGPVIYNAELYDTANDYDIGTGIFTVSRGGKYLFTAALYFSNLTAAAHLSCDTLLVTTDGSYSISNYNGGGSKTSIFSRTLVIDMDVGDTAYVQTTIGGASKTVGLATNASIFTGALLI
jgi:hypothetical protein